MTWSRGAAVTMLVVAVVAAVCSAGLLTGAIPTSGGGPGTTRTIGLVVGALAVPSGLLGWWAMRSYRRARRVLSGGVTGYARVLTMRETGTEYSGVAQLELRLAVVTTVHGAYTTTVKDLVPRLRWARLSAGGQVPVRVDPEDRERVLLDLDRPPGPMDAPIMPVPVVTMHARPQAPPARPMAPVGTVGRGVVLGATPSLEYDAAGRPVFDVRLHLEFDGRAPVSVPARFGVPLKRVASMVAGAELRMRVGADGAVVPDWS
ncbi:hypothetical protein [Dactylosporangium sp. NPDC051541]|uniref:hypothetical protein n=1 Tax=Dactylosporangium sp. NPDC051541 TaxID=3363977 RepID=UPI0037A4B451